MTKVNKWDHVLKKPDSLWDYLVLISLDFRELNFQWVKYENFSEFIE